MQDTTRHPVLIGIDDSLQTLPATEQTTARNRLRDQFNEEKRVLCHKLWELRESAPRQMPRQDIERYHELEIACAYLDDEAPTEEARAHNVAQAINWRKPTGQSSLALQFRRTLELASQTPPQPVRTESLHKPVPAAFAPALSSLT